ncbi:MAG TPA: hypothetical protein PK079_24525 [Leptospiraceae bacterium]|nr:hypothetical protein [Leptospiraceae bacterium]HMW07471.1 hypothetical protein [Leptospiraceae bacterium]HMX34908.1 hypothetical protein [Leptospiraceae bacterium]HMY33135.1 hypothetical protein [Leptospiraceae bacterium]HMZ67361.1 hypothetical protein [Leptospiraceae bacterium]
MNLFRKKLFILGFVLFATVIFGQDRKKVDFIAYRGGWFEIQYPKDFSVKPSIESNLPDKYDSAFFISPDGKVKFYIYSPQWNGEATDIIRDSEIEIEKDARKNQKNGITTKWYTYEKKDGTGLRSYQEILDETGYTKYVIGIEYTDREIYKKYRDDFLKFKKTLKQFAD